ncbi:PIG-L deacetylase family protein [Marinivivus vitaminiproducens]|uniref:PIG-L deacetylase family protein n=1 Tax=Marinivivus vitaminiproducens TaxID=3035935 RepID=UPI00279DD630|nr:PIG-L family deacetylase [Geminicoccaceae bacterium SCSIO 64248]
MHTVTVREALGTLEALPFAGLNTLTGGRPLLVVAPHPDDESLGCGGLIAAAHAAGQRVHVLVVSDGCGSHPGSRAYPPDRLRALREQEAIAAVAELGLAADNVSFLGLPDQRVPTSGPVFEDAIAAVVRLAHAIDAGAVAVTWHEDPHCDHRASYAIAHMACSQMPRVRLWAYPVWAWRLPPGDTLLGRPRGVRLDIVPYLAAKRAAIRAHRSQTTDLIADARKTFRLDETMLRLADRPFEVFLEPCP